MYTTFIYIILYFNITIRLLNNTYFMVVKLLNLIIFFCKEQPTTYPIVMLDVKVFLIKTLSHETISLSLVKTGLF